MFNELNEKIKKSNDQRVKMMFTLVNVMTNTKESSLELRTAVAASVLEMLDTSMLPEDVVFVEFLNNAVDSVCKEAESDRGIPNLKENLRRIINVSREKIDRITEGDSILNNINFN